MSKDVRELIVAEKEALKHYTSLLGKSTIGQPGSSEERGSLLDTKSLEKMGDLYVELNGEKRYSLEITEKLRAANEKILNLEANAKINQRNVDELKKEIIELNSQLQEEKQKYQKVKDQLVSQGEPSAVLSRSLIPAEHQNVQGKLSILKSRIAFLEEENLRLRNQH